VAEKDVAILDLWKKVEGFESEILRLEGDKEKLRIEAADQVKEVQTEAKTRETGLLGRIVTLQDEVAQTKEALSSAQEGAKAKDERIRALEAQLAESVQNAKDKDARIKILEEMDEANKAVKASLEGHLAVDRMSLKNAIECMEENERLFNKWRPKIYQAGYDLCIERALGKVGTADLAAEVHVPPGWWGAEGKDPEFRDYGDSELEEVTDSEDEDEDEEEFDDDVDVGLGLEDVAVETSKGSSSSKKK
jgi:hypothetical protein